MRHRPLFIWPKPDPDHDPLGPADAPELHQPPATSSTRAAWCRSPSTAATGCASCGPSSASPMTSAARAPCSCSAPRRCSTAPPRTSRSSRSYGVPYELLDVRRLRRRRAGAGPGAREDRGRPAAARRRDRRLLQVHQRPGRGLPPAGRRVPLRHPDRRHPDRARARSPASPPTRAPSPATPTSWRSAATRRCCCARSGSTCRSTRSRATRSPIPITDPAGAPESTVMDETHKVAITRLGDRIRVGGMAELDGYSTKLRAGAPRHARACRHRPLPQGRRRRQGQLLVRPAADDAGRPAGDRPERYDNLYLNTGHGTWAGPWPAAPAGCSPT